MQDLRFFDTKVIALESISSTNTFIKNASNEDKNTKYLAVKTDYQSLGVGQRGSEWMSEPMDSVLTSISMRPEYTELDGLYKLSLSIPLAVAKTLEKVLSLHHIYEPVYIKWPNDMIILHKKIGGILIEKVWQGDIVKQVIIGIGINVFQSNFPSNLENAASFRTLFPNEEWSLYEIYSTLYAELESMLKTYKKLPVSDLVSDYNSKLYKNNEIIEGWLHEHPIKAKNMGVDNLGHLHLRIEGEGNPLILSSSRDFKWKYT